MSRIVVPTPGMRAAAPDLIGSLEPVYIAETEAEREAGFSFRYSVYGAELGRKLGGADHGRQRVHDAEDDQPYTTLLYTDDGAGQLTGTIRIRRWEPGEVPAKDWEAFSMERFAGIAQEMFERARHLLGIERQRGVGRAESALDPHIVGPLGRRPHEQVGDEGMHVDRHEEGLMLVGVKHQLPHDVGAAAAGLDDRVAVGADLRVVGRALPQQRPGPAQLVTACGHRLHQRGRQRAARCLLRQLGEEQRVSLGSLVQLVGAC